MHAIIIYHVIVVTLTKINDGRIGVAERSWRAEAAMKNPLFECLATINVA